MAIKSQTNDRKKVLILGNGFDLDLGRKTLYKDFYKSEYCPKDYPAPLIKHLNDKWVDDLEDVKWYDLENEFYNYYEHIHHYGKMDVYEEFEKSYIDHFRNQNFLVPLYGGNYSSKDRKILYGLIEKGLLTASFPSSYIQLSNKDLLLTPEQRDFKALQLIKEKLIEYLKIQQSTDINKDSVAAIVAKLFSKDNAENKQIYSFNYTNIKDVSYDSIFSEWIDTSIKYVHGNINDKNVILGTKDNPFEAKYDFLQKTFDTKYNPPAMVYDLMNADDVFIFGHSLGMNDSQYFQAFFERQSTIQNPQSKNITIFTKNEKSEFAIKRALQEMTNYKLSSLFGLNKLLIIKTDELYADHNKFTDVLVDIFSISKYDANFWIKGNND